MKKSILLTNHELTQISGSELDTITIAKYFQEQNYDVSIFTLNVDYPMLNEIDEKIKIITYKNLNDLKDHYDIIWAHHFPLLDYLLFHKQISADYIHYLALSSVEAYEALPEYYQELNMVSAFSKHTIDALKKEKYNVNNINIFTNYTKKEFFEIENEKKELNKLCIISNHVPEELLDFVQIYEKKENKKIDIYGVNHKYIKITPEILSKYDLIITIGKTVNMALALKIPVYCYDRFGGEGYLTMNNIQGSYDYAFCGKYTCKKRTANEIYNDIIENYKNCIKDSDKLKKFAYDNFCFEKQMEKVLEKLNKTSKFSLQKTLKNHPQLIRKSQLFFEKMSQKINIINNLKPQTILLQIFYDYGKGFSEKDSSTFNYQINGNIYYKKIKIPKNTKNIRLDISSIKYTRIYSIKVNNKELNLKNLTNCYKNSKGVYVSVNNDPNITITNENFNDLEILVEMDIIDQEELINEILHHKSKFSKNLKKQQ